ncbi:MAG: hypothetical protein J6N20_00240 [Pseudomonas sp.]|nr:hypothetical protein [Pseudomonas sp.]
MLKPKYIKHLKIRSEKLRAIMHDMWLLGNDSFLYLSDPQAEVERRQAITDRLVKEGYATLVEVPDPQPETSHVGNP